MTLKRSCRLTFSVTYSFDRVYRLPSARVEGLPSSRMLHMTGEYFTGDAIHIRTRPFPRCDYIQRCTRWLWPYSECILIYNCEHVHIVSAYETEDDLEQSLNSSFQ